MQTFKVIRWWQVEIFQATSGGDLIELRKRTSQDVSRKLTGPLLIVEAARMIAGEAFDHLFDCNLKRLQSEQFCVEIYPRIKRRNQLEPDEFVDWRPATNLGKKSPHSLALPTALPPNE